MNTQHNVLWCFTLRKCSNIKSVKALKGLFEKYNMILNRIRERAKQAIEYHYEIVYPKVARKPNLNVHVHGMFLTTPGVEVKLPPVKSYHIHIEQVRSELAWRTYITKQSIDEADIEELVKEYFSDPENVAKEKNSEETVEQWEARREFEENGGPPTKRLF